MFAEIMGTSFADVLYEDAARDVVLVRVERPEGAVWRLETLAGEVELREEDGEPPLRDDDGHAVIPVD